MVHRPRQVHEVRITGQLRNEGVEPEVGLLQPREVPFSSGSLHSVDAVPQGLEARRKTGIVGFDGLRRQGCRLALQDLAHLQKRQHVVAVGFQPGEPVGRVVGCAGEGRHEGTTSLPHIHKAQRRQDLNRLADGGRAHAQAGRKLLHRWQAISWTEASVADQLTDPLDYLRGAGLVPYGLEGRSRHQVIR